MTLIAIEWDDAAGHDGRGAVRLLDQTLLPGTTTYRHIVTHRRPRRRDRRAGRPRCPGPRRRRRAGGRAGHGRGRPRGLGRRAPSQAAVDRVRHARPTAVNLAWGVDEVRPLMATGRDAVLEAARRVAREDEAANRELSRLGADWLLDRVDRPRLRVLTHCNTGFLATSAWGTALGVIRELHARDRIELVYADETRPLLQGARLTAYELANDGIPHVVQADSAPPPRRSCAAWSTSRSSAPTGSPPTATRPTRSAPLGVALACRDAGIPFMVAAPWSTVDLSMADGSGIEIEERAGRGGHRAGRHAPRARGDPRLQPRLRRHARAPRRRRGDRARRGRAPDRDRPARASPERTSRRDTRTAGRHPRMPTGRPVCGGVRRSRQRTTLNALTLPAP